MIDLPALRQSQRHPLDGIIYFVSIVAAVLHLPMTTTSVIYAFVCAYFVMSDMWSDALRAMIYAIVPIAVLYCIRWVQAILIRISER